MDQTKNMQRAYDLTRWRGKEPEWKQVAEFMSTMDECTREFEALTAAHKRMTFKSGWFGSSGKCQLFEPCVRTVEH
jgi:hypothetical protein